MRSILKFSGKYLFGIKRFFPNNTNIRFQMLLRHKYQVYYTSMFKTSCEYLEWVVKKLSHRKLEAFCTVF